MACRNTTPFLTGFNLLRSGISIIGSGGKADRLSLAVRGVRSMTLPLSELRLNLWAKQPRDQKRTVAVAEELVAKAAKTKSIHKEAPQDR